MHCEYTDATVHRIKVPLAFLYVRFYEPNSTGQSDGKTHELGSAQTRSWRTAASNGFAEF